MDRCGDLKPHFLPLPGGRRSQFLAMDGPGAREGGLRGQGRPFRPAVRHADGLHDPVRTGRVGLEEHGQGAAVHGGQGHLGQAARQHAALRRLGRGVLHRGQGLGVVELALEEAAVHEHLHATVQGQEQRAGAQGGQHDAPDALGAREQRQERTHGGGLGEEDDQQDACDRRVDHCLADDDVDVHQPVLEDAHGERDGYQHVERLDHQVAHVQVLADAAEGQHRDDIHRYAHQHRAGQCHDGAPERPAELALLLGVGLPVAGHQGDAGQSGIDKRDGDERQEHARDQQEAPNHGNAFGKADPRQQSQAAHRQRQVNVDDDGHRQPRVSHPAGEPAALVEAATESDGQRRGRAQQHQTHERAEPRHPFGEQAFQQGDEKSGKNQQCDQGDWQDVNPDTELGPPPEQAERFRKYQRQVQEACGEQVRDHDQDRQTDGVDAGGDEPDADGRQVRLEDDRDQQVAAAGGHGKNEEQAGPEILGPPGEHQKADAQEGRGHQQVGDQVEPGAEAGQGVGQAQPDHPLPFAGADRATDGIARTERAVQLVDFFAVIDGDAVDGDHAVAGAEPRRLGRGSGQDARDLARRRHQGV